MRISIKGLITLIIIIVVIVLVGVHSFFCMRHLPKGELLNSYISPSGKYVVNAYICEGNATNGESIRCEAVTEQGVRNIYWQYKESCVDCVWISDDVIRINGREINVKKDVYDWRR